MRTKIKTIVAVITILILASVAVFIYKSKSNTKNAEGIAPITQTKEQKVALDAERERAANIKTVQTTVVSTVSTGTLTSINGNTLSIKNKDEEIVVNITDTTAFYIMEKGSPIMKTKDDLKQGGEIMVEYDENSKNAIAINITQK